MARFLTPSKEGAYPGRMCCLRLVAVAVGKIIHHLAVVHTTLMVYLPEDNAAMLRGSYAIATGGIEHLLPCQVACARHCLTKLITDGEAALPEVGRAMSV